MVPMDRVVDMRCARRDWRGEAGFSLPEILVSIIVLALVAGGAVSVLVSSGKATAQERIRAQAAAIAQADQVRMRAMKISDFGHRYSRTATVRQGTNTFTVTSTAEFITESSGTSSCTENTASTEVLRVKSSVTWASIGSRPPVVLESLIAPPTGYTAPNRGSLQISVQNAAGTARNGVSVTGTGPTNFSGTTGTNGCVIFGNLPTGTYSVTASLPGLVDVNGNASAPQSVDIVGQAEKTLTLVYDTPGRITASFRVRNYSGTVVSGQQATGIVVFNTGMELDRVFGTGGLATTQQTTSTLFPFTSPYAVYAGRCSANNPGSGAGIVSASVSPGQNVTLGTAIQLFPLYLNVYTGTSASGARSSGAQVRIEDLDCPGTVYNYTTDSNGQITVPGPGLPYSDYEVCVRGPSTSGTRRVIVASTAVKSLTGTTLNVALRNGSTSGLCG
jgi:prepilin-type N-terminal cleavage/methylation domain-containing protein